MRVLQKREKRLLVYLAIIIVILFCDYIYRRSNVTITKETKHYIIFSSATTKQTNEIADIAEITYDGYLEFIKQLNLSVQPHPRLKMKLFKDRKEFRRCNRIYSWCEAFYKYPYCCQYYSSEEINPYHWMMHEATHQLNAEVAHLSLPKWLDEGFACYIATSRVVGKSLHLGKIDTDTYPIWWLGDIAIAGDLDTDKNNRSIMPLRVIISGHGGPDMDKYFNLYYLHWWSIAHFLMHYDDGKYTTGLKLLISDGGDLPSFEKNIGEIEIVERQWYEHVNELKRKY